MKDINPGLEGVLVGETAISQVDGAHGVLSYRGIDIAELAKRPMLQVAWLLLFGEAPTVREETQLAHFLLAHRALADSERKLLAALGPETHPMLMLQSLVPVLDLQPQEELEIPFGGDTALRGLIIAAKIPGLIAAWCALQQGRERPPRCNSLDPLRAFLKSLHNREPSDLAVEALNRTQILQMEHGYNAGTFAGRVALSTGTPIESSISASIGTLFGPLHGGADQAALAFARAVGHPDNASSAVAAVLAEGGKIMGMGHREYRTLDPRAALLKPMAQSLCAADAEAKQLLETLEAIETACARALARPGRELHANVEFYKGAVFHALGVPDDCFTAMFTMARVYGYLAHALEFQPVSRLIRPRARYIGPQPKEAA